jgi:hypothetical protein
MRLLRAGPFGNRAGTAASAGKAGAAPYLPRRLSRKGLGVGVSAGSLSGAVMADTARAAVSPPGPGFRPSRWRSGVGAAW